MAGTSEVREDEVGDYTKSRLVHPEERQSRLHLLKDSLAALGRDLDSQTLDAVVVSGDVALQGDADSYKLLPEVLGTLGAALPPPERIIVVPGNHDVLYGSPPGSARRFEAFGDAIDSLGYRRPALEGRDDFGNHDPLLVDPNGAYAIVAMNSSNWSVAFEPLSERAQAQLDDLQSRGLIPDDLAKAIKDLRLHDASRVSLQQMTAVGRALGKVPRSPDRRPVIFAVLHHQLFPVTMAEEVKSFETMTNLAELRRFFADNSVDVVLHGHKHAARIFEDEWTESPPAGAGSPSHRLVVCSAGTVGHGVGQGAEIAKLIEIDDDLPSVPKVTISPVAAVGPAAQLKILVAERRSFRFVEDVQSGSALKAFQAQSAAMVHSLLLASFADQESEADSASNLACVILDGPTALSRPSSYPALGDHPLAENPDAFFDDLVDWWQDSRRGDGKPFTHGQRICDWSEDADHDQLVNVANTLVRDESSSRGLVSLFDPNRDEIDDIAAKFPAFVLAQFHIRESALHVLGVFRKQEMRYWWPINVAELARMQARVIELLGRQGKNVAPGSITTFSTQAKVGRTIPRVAVPRLDQLVWEGAGQVWALAASISLPADAARLRASVEQLCQLMNEWKPADREAPDGAPVAGPGLILLRDALLSLGQSLGTAKRTQRLVELLELLVATNERYRIDDPGRALPYSDWRDQTRANIDEFCEEALALQL